MRDGDAIVGNEVGSWCKRNETNNGTFGLVIKTVERSIVHAMVSEIRESKRNGNNCKVVF